MTALVLILMPSFSIFAHGTLSNPPSRVYNCFLEGVDNPESQPCIDAVISHGTQGIEEYYSILQNNGLDNHENLIPDGNLASGGNPDIYGAFDQIRDDWVATEVEPGPYTVTWTNAIPHFTLYYEVYITNSTWTPDQPLTWDSLELLVRTDSRPPMPVDDIDVVLPERTGKHVIYSIWQRSGNPQAFYAASDVDFGGVTEIENTPPVASFNTSTTSGPAPLQVTFDGSGSSDADGDSLSYTWNFGNGETSTMESPTITFDEPGSYLVSLVVSDGIDTSEEVTETITVEEVPNEVPIASFTSSTTSGEAPLEVTFDASESSDADGDELTFAWDFGNGETSTMESPTVTFEEAGSYLVTLVVSDGTDISEPVTATITVEEQEIVENTPAVASAAADV